ncbi:MAG TPA: four helix bundle protein [Fimbriimonadaceae bacterium]|nr:four helix bundle protein [Fimbriimonadaceae bacterium]
MGETSTRKVTSHHDLDVWKRARELAYQAFELSKGFPREETYSLTDQIRRSSRSVTANIAEAWQKRRYEASFIHKLTDAAAEAAETQDWFVHAADAGYLSGEDCDQYCRSYEDLLKTLHSMMFYAAKWCRPVSSHKPQTTHHTE